MTPETIATIREVLETEVETSGCAADSAKRQVEHAEYRTRRAKTEGTRFHVEQHVDDARKQLEAETIRHDRAKVALDEFNAAYPIVALIVCGECNGEGRTKPPIDMVCSWCNGKGKVEDK